MDGRTAKSLVSVVRKREPEYNNTVFGTYFQMNRKFGMALESSVQIDNILVNYDVLTDKNKTFWNSVRF